MGGLAAKASGIWDRATGQCAEQLGGREPTTAMTALAGAATASASRWTVCRAAACSTSFTRAPCGIERATLFHEVVLHVPMDRQLNTRMPRSCLSSSCEACLVAAPCHLVDPDTSASASSSRSPSSVVDGSPGAPRPRRVPPGRRAHSHHEAPIQAANRSPPPPPCAQTGLPTAPMGGAPGVHPCGTWTRRSGSRWIAYKPRGLRARPHDTHHWWRCVAGAAAGTSFLWWNVGAVEEAPLAPRQTICRRLCGRGGGRGARRDRPRGPPTAGRPHSARRGWTPAGGGRGAPPPVVPRARGEIRRGPRAARQRRWRRHTAGGSRDPPPQRPVGGMVAAPRRAWAPPSRPPSSRRVGPERGAPMTPAGAAARHGFRRRCPTQWVAAGSPSLPPPRTGRRRHGAGGGAVVTNRGWDTSAMLWHMDPHWVLKLCFAGGHTGRLLPHILAAILPVWKGDIVVQRQKRPGVKKNASVRLVAPEDGKYGHEDW